MTAGWSRWWRKLAISNRTKRQNITALAYDRKGNLLAVGKNSYTKTHPLQAKYGKLAGKPNAIYLHAEIAALVRARGNVHKLVVLRYGANGKPLLAKPCKACQLAIKDFGVKQVEHT